MLSISIASIEPLTFLDCTSLTNVMIPNSVTSIGLQAFNWCTSLTSVTIPNSVTNISYFAFNSCTSLKSVTFGNSVTRIEELAFYGDISLASVTLPNSLTSIGIQSFENCTMLTNVSIPKSVINIGSYAFQSCSNLAGVYFTGNSPTPTNDLSVFKNDNNATVYYLPGTTGWGSIFDGRPTALWLPLTQTTGISFDAQSNQFGFNIKWASDKVVVVEACTNLAIPVWNPVSTNTLTGGTSYFSDPQWANYPGRFYRLRSP